MGCWWSSGAAHMGIQVAATVQRGPSGTLVRSVTNMSLWCNCQSGRGWEEGWIWVRPTWLGRPGLGLEDSRYLLSPPWAGRFE